MTYEWSIRAIKHWPDGSWDALLCWENQNRWSGIDRVVSTDGFNWTEKNGGKVEAHVQQMLAEAIGDMETHGIRYVVF